LFFCAKCQAMAQILQQKCNKSEANSQKQQQMTAETTS